MFGAFIRTRKSKTKSEITPEEEVEAAAKAVAAEIIVAEPLLPLKKARKDDILIIDTLFPRAVSLIRKKITRGYI
ncbi:hypothetical protein CP533_0850 [Ophiocordyceps camponoti-saundersi (nom. inval.)]|nr:hypothetical protein CP533_0850 [Ophiocordyceps camponoti-saundersi (nom. inval.)]